MPQGIFSHPTLTEVLLNSEVFPSALFLPALMNSSSFFCAKFRQYIFAYVLACKPEYVMEDFENGKTPQTMHIIAPGRFFILLGAYIQLSEYFLIQSK